MKRKGFTLIELLAVIVILAVIALIATPIIMNVINDSKEGAAKDAMYGYVKAVELASTDMITATTDAPSGSYTTKDGNLYNGSIKILDISFKGTKPADNGTVILSHGSVTQSTLIFDGIKIAYDGKKAEVLKTYRVGEVIYYNPETNQKCTSSEVNTAELAKTGCLKWNVITMDDATNKTSINVMLDHNTTKNVAWNSSGNNAGGMKEVATALTNDTASWHTSIKSTARLIAGQEVANIGGDTVWNTGNYTGKIYSTQPWLYQNLSEDNTNAKPYAYWTSTADSSNVSGAWRVHYAGELNRADIASIAHYGVRPVITIAKSIIA